jgi:hypothetical protein
MYNRNKYSNISHNSLDYNIFQFKALNFKFNLNCINHFTHAVIIQYNKTDKGISNAIYRKLYKFVYTIYTFFAFHFLNMFSDEDKSATVM